MKNIEYGNSSVLLGVVFRAYAVFYGCFLCFIEGVF